MPRVLALYAGRGGSLATSKGTIRTAIAKTPVAGRTQVGLDGLAGDEQISPDHGGPDRALCLYPREHYAHWAARVKPAFGENVTSEGVLEPETIAAGDGIAVISRPLHGVTVADAVRARLRRRLAASVRLVPL